MAAAATPDVLPKDLVGITGKHGEAALRAWLARGGSIDAVNSFGTLLADASYKRHLPSVQLLLSLGAKADLRVDPEASTPLILAAMGEHDRQCFRVNASAPCLGIIQALLEAGADVNATMCGGLTAWSYAEDMPTGTDKDAIIQLLQQRMRSPRPAAAASSSAAAAASSEDEPVVTGSRTREQIDAEKRRSAIDLDETPAKRPKVEKRTPATAPLPSPATSAPSQAVEGLAALVKGLPADVQAAASAWCAAQKVASVELIAECDQDVVFVAALGFTPPATMGETVLRKRLAKLRDGAA